MTTESPTNGQAATVTDRDFLDDFATMSTFGATARGGVDRQAATLADGQTRSWFRGICEARGFTVHYDRIGNQFAVLDEIPNAPYVVMGSHLDSQPLGGRFDGAYGVLAAAHAAARVRDSLPADQRKFNIAVANWFNEEGCRFKPSMMGSSVFTGKLDLDAALATTDPQGVTVAEALARIGTIGEFEPEIAAYIEIHIEQGRSLDDAGITIGLVESTWGAQKYEYTVHGEQSHTGATVIADRRDALYAAAAMVVAAREVAEEFTGDIKNSADATGDEGMVITSCGEFNVFPNSPVVVASRVDLLLDVRSNDADLLARADEEFLRRVDEIAAKANVEIERGAEHHWGAKEYDEAGMRLAASSAEALGLTHRVVRTLAGHDSTNLKDLVPTIMLFIPSVDGITHNELEFSRDDDMTAGVKLLTEVARRVVAGELTA